jgi:hypothetical protein
LNEFLIWFLLALCGFRGFTQLPEMVLARCDDSAESKFARDRLEFRRKDVLGLGMRMAALSPFFPEFPGHLGEKQAALHAGGANAHTRAIVLHSEIFQFCEGRTPWL